MGQSQSNTMRRPSSRMAFSSRSSYLDRLSINSDDIDLDENAEKTQEGASSQRRNSKPLSLTTLPTELQLALFEFLDPVTSTCLGLTCKEFYAIHWSKHGRVRLYAPEGHLRGTPSIAFPSSVALWDLLKDWFPTDMRYNRIVGRYMGKEKYDKFMRDYMARLELRPQCCFVQKDHSRGSMGR